MWSISNALTKFRPAVESVDYLPFDPPYVDDPDWLLGQRVTYSGRRYYVVAWKERWGGLWVHLVPVTGWCDRWVLADDCELGW